jgi:hypothetical protein
MHFRTPGVAHHHALGAAWVSNIRHTVVLTFVRDLSDHVHSKPIDVELRSGFDECMMLWVLLGSMLVWRYAELSSLAPVFQQSSTAAGLSLSIQRA